MAHIGAERRIYIALAALTAAAAVAAAYATLSHRGGAASTVPPAAAATTAPPVPIPQWLTEAPRSIAVSSPAFPEGGTIPPRYTCDGADVSPPLRWSNIPGDARSLLILMYDPDAPNGFFIHWVLYNAPPELRGLPEAVPREPVTRYGMQAVNDFRRIGYGGPCPPPGSRHRYVIIVAALDEKLSLPPGVPAREVLAQARGHVLAYGLYYGVYKRQG